MSEDKIYVAVTSRCEPDGSFTPLSVGWADGREFEIDRVLDARPAASLRVGGAGWRFLCLIGGRRSYLYYEECGRWFVEKKQV